MANNTKSETMLMSGVTVDFPYKPYPCQIAMLGKIIKTLQQSKNCLIESPTGTGKTLTLLCASLAWQQKEIEQLRTPSSENKDDPTQAAAKPTAISTIYYCTRTHKQLEQVARQLSNTIYKDKIRMTLLSSRDNYCVHPTISKGPNKNYECTKITRPSHDNYSLQTLKNGCAYYERLKGKLATDFIRSYSKPLPRVFDIEQFSDYCRKSHGICPYFTSRLLINDVQIVLCPYNYLIDPRVRNSMRVSLNNAVVIIDEAHNIEDCARESMKFELRKYDFEQALEEIRTNQKAFALAQVKIAELLVNESGFSLTQEPISSTAFTQAQEELLHRSAGYSEFDELNEGTDLLEHLNIDQHGNQNEPALNTNEPSKLTDDQEVANAFKFLTERFLRLLLWFDAKDAREKYTFTPKELIEEFHQAKFIDKSIINVHKPATKSKPAASHHVAQDAVRIRRALAKGLINRPEYIKISDETARFLEDFDLCLSVLYADDQKFIDDYKIVLKTIPFEPSANAISQMQQRSQISTDVEDAESSDTRSQSSQVKRSQRSVTQTTYPLHTQQLVFYCLSPSVAFSKDLRLARSLIFASGTLAPLATYAGELKVPFDIRMECNHVIDVDRTFITALSHGRNSNIKLRATYQNTERPEFQDECGLIVLDVCRRVPFGILCFVPSYRFLNVIINRWMASGLWQQLNEHKSVFFEEKNGSHFQNTINRFREANGTMKIVEPESITAKRVKEMFKTKKTSDEVSKPSVAPKGGLLLAVCRGRASEGIDFSDNNARCVMTLGIPYPNVQDEEVCFKRNYNNEQNKRIPEVMNGSDWYDSQAYRALNQALGRCIRHKNDWGALIIVEERIVNSINDKHFNNKISLWIKQRLRISQRYEDTMNSLETFVGNMQKSDELSMLEKQQEELEKQQICDEQQQLNSVLPVSDSKEVEKAVENETPQYRKFQVDHISEDESADNVQTFRMKQNAFQSFIAQRQASVSAENANPRQMESKINSTNYNNQSFNKNYSNQRRRKSNQSRRPQPKTNPSMLTPAASMNSSKTQPVIDLTESYDDNDDFEPVSVYFSNQPNKRLKST